MVGAEGSPAGKPGGAVFAGLSSRVSRAAALWERLLAVAGIAALVAGTLPGLSAAADRALTLFCLLVALVFAIQYGRGLLHATDRLKWASSGPALIDLLAAAPIPVFL